MDAHYFLSCVQEVDRFNRQKDNGKAKACALMEQAMRVYHGSFLPGDDEAWILPTRQKLTLAFHKCVSTLGRSYEQDGRLEKAVDLYMNALEVDPLVENFYRSLMLCYLKMEKPAEARKAYLRCRETLTKLLGVEPSRQTSSLFKHI